MFRVVNSFDEYSVKECFIESVSTIRASKVDSEELDEDTPPGSRISLPTDSVLEKMKQAQAEVKRRTGTFKLKAVGIGSFLKKSRNRAHSTFSSDGNPNKKTTKPKAMVATNPRSSRKHRKRSLAGWKVLK